MRSSWKLGRFAGIDVYLHPTFLLLLAFFAFSDGGLGSLSMVIAAFSCVLLHEYGHALAARRFGIETEDITLYPIGGVARLRRMPRAPGVEIVVALAGPAVNVAIMAGLLALGVSGLVPPDSPAARFGWGLFAINLMLAGFNLIPAFPMDGGRVFRALLSGWIGRLKATAIAAGLGRGLAVLFGVWCVTQSMWPQAALALFIYWAAGAELASVVADEYRRRAERFEGDSGSWDSPPGYRWVQRGQGVWFLAPVVVASGGPRSRPGWR